MTETHAGEARLPQGRVRYRELGTGEPIVLVHGLLTNGELWREVAPRLAADFRVIVPDWPLGSHEIPMDDGADLSPLGLARIIADFLAELNLGCGPIRISRAAPQSLLQRDQKPFDSRMHPSLGGDHQGGRHRLIAQEGQRIALECVFSNRMMAPLIRRPSVPLRS